MKNLKIWSLMALMLVAIGCNNNGDKPVNNGDNTVVGEWQLTAWNDAAPEFNVYIDFNSDYTFTIYQQVWTLNYECYEGKYQVNGSVITGQYADNSNWASGYKFELNGKSLTLYSQEDQSVKSVYEKCEIPEEIIAEATTTRSADVTPWL